MKLLSEESLLNASESKEGAMVLAESALVLHPFLERAKQEIDSNFCLEAQQDISEMFVEFIH